MFPIDACAKNYHNSMLDKFDLKLPFVLKEILPTILLVGEKAGEFTKECSKFLDIGCDLQSGIPLCPPEGDAGSGMSHLWATKNAEDYLRIKAVLGVWQCICKITQWH